MMGFKDHKRDGLFIKALECGFYCGVVVFSYYFAWHINITGLYDANNLAALNNSAAPIAIGAAVIFVANGLFKTLRKSFVENAVMMLMSSFYIAVFTMAIAFYSRSFALPRSMILVAFMFQVITLSITKCFIISILRKTHGDRSILIVAPMEEKEALISKLLSDYRFTDKLYGYIEPGSKAVENCIPKVDHILVSDSVDPLLLDELIRTAMSHEKRLYLIPRIYEIAVINAAFTQYSDLPLLKVDNLNLSWERALIKRGMDLVISLPALVLLLPVMAVIACAILITDGRPVLYIQERATINNRTFRLYKFRSMWLNAESECGAVLASENDPRITPVGIFLRRFWLDELPQLINVIKGDMSLVGPRPERPVFIKQFAEEIPDFQYRLSVKAGVTGLAQVMGKYTTSPETKIKFDLMYIRNSGVLFDLRILADTVKKVILGTLKRGENPDMNHKEALASRGIEEYWEGDVLRFRTLNKTNER